MGARCFLKDVKTDTRIFNPNKTLCYGPVGRETAATAVELLEQDPHIKRSNARME